MNRLLFAAFLFAVSGPASLAAGLEGFCIDLGEEGCTDRYLPFESMSVSFCEETCTLSNPVSIRGLDATLYDYKCVSDSPVDFGDRVIIIKQIISETESKMSFIDGTSILPITKCPAQ